MTKAVESDWLKRWSLYSPDRIAIDDYKKQKTYSYQDLYYQSQVYAVYLKSIGVKPGDRLASLSQNRVETVILFFALQRLGAILVPINFRLSASEIEYILQDCGAKILFYENEFSDTVKKIISDRLHIANPKTNLSLTFLPYEDLEKTTKPIDNSKAGLSTDEISRNTSPDSIPEAVISTASPEAKLKFNNSKTEQTYTEFNGDFETSCMILYTSGTTGFPKGAVLSNKMLFWNALNTSLSLNITQEDVTINFAPLFHTGGWNVLMTPFFHRGAKVVFLDKFDAEDILKLSSKFKATLLFGVPTMLTMMAESKSFESTDLSSIRYMVVGGEPMPIDLIQKWHAKGVPIRQGFGLTEFGPNCFSLSEKDAEKKMGSIGRPNFYVQTRIVNNEGKDVAIGEVGELLLSGPCCMSAYWNNEKATKETIIDGWLYTGDLVKKDTDNYFFVVGRKKEMFISGGENVYPVEVERVLKSHPEIKEVAVVGVEDEKWGEVGHAYISVKSSFSMTKNISSDNPQQIETFDLAAKTIKRAINESDLKEFCKAQLAGFKIPKYFSFLEELPKGDSGKINKKVLRTYNTNLMG